MATTGTTQMPGNKIAIQKERQPGIEKDMSPRPVYDNDEPGCGKLKNKVAIVTGGDSGIGRAVAISFAKEGADVAIVYVEREQADAEETAAGIKKYGKEALLIPADLAVEKNNKLVVDKTIERFGRIDIVVNNAGVQYPEENIENISGELLEHTFRVNIFAQFYLAKYAVPHLQPGSTIINTASINAYKGNQSLMDYSATKGAIVSFTRSLSQSLAEKGIRVNGVAPGPVWTPLIPASFPKEKVEKFGDNTAFGRAAQPVEIAPCYVFLASKDADFITGQVLHPNGGTVVNA